MHLNPRIAALLNGLNNPSLPGVDLSLVRMAQLLEALGNPQLHLPPVIHLAGTNGKGSTQAFLRAMFRAAGKRVHAYTSPHLVRFNERIVLAGAEISDDALLPLLEEVTQAAKHIPVTFFEATTAAAFLAFARVEADVVVLETGLGGRLDATNLVPQPALTVLTPIGMDHMEFLGGSLAGIATEKAGILKAEVPCVVAPQAPEALAAIAVAASKLAVPLLLHGRDWHGQATPEGLEVTFHGCVHRLPHPNLPGQHQYGNAALAAVTALHMGLSVDSVAQGIATAQWPARLQRLTHGPLVDAWGARGEVYLDGGHNVHAAEALAPWLASRAEPVTLLLGMMARKDASAFLAPLAPYLSQAVTLPIEGEDAYAPDLLAERARTVLHMPVEAASSEAVAAERLAGAAPGTLLIAGSLFLAGQILKTHG